MKSQQKQESLQEAVAPAVPADGMDRFVEALFQVAERIECQERRLRQSLSSAARDGDLPLVQQLLEEWDDLGKDD